MSYNDGPGFGTILACGVIVLGGFFALSCFEIVSPGHRGVVTRLGTVQPEPLRLYYCKNHYKKEA